MQRPTQSTLRPDPAAISRRRPSPPPTVESTDLITLIRFEWTTSSGSQPVLYVDRRRLH
jgi:hypothetical protein